MPLYIRDDDVRAMAQRLAEARRQTVTETVRRALARELAELEAETEKRESRLLGLFARWRAGQVGRDWGDAELYDAQGLPR